jgi:hypothetical protein
VNGSGLARMEWRSYSVMGRFERGLIADGTKKRLARVQGIKNTDHMERKDGNEPQAVDRNEQNYFQAIYAMHLLSAKSVPLNPLNPMARSFWNSKPSNESRLFMTRNC